MEKRISALEARKQFGRLLEEVFYQNHDIIIERAGRPMAVLVPLEQYRQWQQRRATFFAMIDEVQRRTRQSPPEELEALIAEAVIAARAEGKAANIP